MKILKMLLGHIPLVFSLFLLAFIPLYPKRPLLDIQHTWVYVRVEDFIVAFALTIWIILFLKRKVTLKTPLTLPIILFWIIGGIATLHGVLLIFPKLTGVYSNVALLSFLRKIEYMSLFFIAFTAMKEKKYIFSVIITLACTLLAVAGYGFGQKYYGFPAYLTMNEEFAKGIPIQISELARVPSTFAGHYDLAAYLVLVIPILVSLAFGFKNWLMKLFLFSVSVFGFILLFMTVSRVSFFVLVLALGMLLFLQKKRLLIISFIILSLVSLSFFPNLLQRFGNTVTETDVLVDAKSGEAIGNIKELKSDSLQNKIFVREAFVNGQAMRGVKDASVAEVIAASSSAVIPLSQVPKSIVFLEEPNAPTGENLPQGTGYVNLELSPIKKKIGQFFYQVPNVNDRPSDKIIAFSGNFIIKRAKAYDLSYTTRFQGEWPRTIEAFRENIFFGSGYGSVSLAVDNNYLRILGEIGIVGFMAFLTIFTVAGIYVRKILPGVESPVVRSFVLGFIAGTFGLMLNATLIDVFEASKVAFTYWLLMGITLGMLHLHKREDIQLYTEFKTAITSQYAVIFYLFIITFTLFASAYHYYFVGDDFTWLRWAASCSTGSGQCQLMPTIVSYFTSSDGFFYRPGTKLYFLFMYSTFWLNQTLYHSVSIFLHFSFAVILFFIAKRILKNYLLAASSAAIFLILSGNSEDIFWAASTGHLFNAVFALLSLLFFMFWKETNRRLYFIICIISIAMSLLFHELGIVVPFLIILYDIVFGDKFSIKKISNTIALLFPLLPYLLLRYISGSHWFNGDYSYNILKLPFNVVGNIIGYLFIALFGPQALPIYQGLRFISREHVIIMIPIILICIILGVVVFRMFVQKMAIEDKRIIIFSSLFFVIALMPFLGLGNIALRYNYLASVGFVMLLTYIFKKIYDYLRTIVDGNTVIGIITTIVLIFSSIHLFQLQQMHNDWHAAGEKSEKFLIGLNEVYVDDWTKRDIRLYFVDVPIRHGDAWIFPVGLKDAVWFVFQNDNIQVHQMASVEEAITLVQDPKKDKVFLFDSAGGLIEKQKLPDGKVAN